MERLIGTAPIWNIIWTVINLIVFFVLMKVFLFKPIKKVLQKRQDIVDEQLNNAQKTNEEADAKLADYEEKIANVEDEKKQIIDDARTNAKAEYDKIIGRAHDDAEKLKDDAKKQIEAENEKAKRQVKDEIASLAVETAEKVIGNSIDEKANSDILDQFLSEGSEE